MKKLLLGALSAALLFGNVYAEESIDDSIAVTKEVVKHEEHKSSNLLSERMRKALEDQIVKELYSSNLYLSYASYFADLGLDGCEKFFRDASADEREHAVLFMNHLIDRNEKCSLQAVKPIEALPISVLDGFTKLLHNEMGVTTSIHNLYTIALEEKDYASQVFLHSFLLLQIEEEKQAQDLLQLLQSGRNDPAFILMFDQKLTENLED